MKMGDDVKYEAAKRVDDGGPAFPSDQRNDYDVATLTRFGGMSLRDYFAAQALAGCMAYYNGSSGDHHTNSTPEQTAEMCYRIADGMLAARSRPAPGQS